MNDTPTLPDDHVEVFLEDLFIEDYEIPLTLPVQQPQRRAASRSLPLVGIAVMGGLTVAAALFGRTVMKRTRKRWYRL
jgi:hypothetical protein